MSESLGDLAEALAAQPVPRAVGFYASYDGKSFPLRPHERIALFTELLRLVPGDEEATAELAAARRDEAGKQGGA